MTAPPVRPTALDQVLDEAFAHALTSLAGTATAVSLALGGLEPVDLPPAGADPGDAEWLAVAGPLYLAANLEAAGVVVGAETIAGLVVSGGLAARLDDDAVRMAVAFWRGRTERLVAAERREFLVHVFGRLPGLDPPDPTRDVRAALRPGRVGPPSTAQARDDAPESAMIGLADVLLDEDGTGHQARRHAARCASASALGQELLTRAGAVPTVVAADLVASCTSSLALLRQPSVVAALQARTVWGALGTALRRYRGEDRPVGLHVGVGRDGVLLLGWLRGAWPEVESGRCTSATAPGDVVTTAAASWLRGSLALHEQHDAGRGAVAGA